MKRYIFGLLLLVCAVVFADTPPVSRVTARIQDSAGNSLTSTVDGAKRGLDVNLLPNSSITADVSTSLVDPLFVQPVFGGSAVDVRARTWTLSNTTDSVVAHQGGSWSFGLPAGASTSALQSAGNISLGSIDTKITTATNGIRVHLTQVPLPTGSATEAKQDAQDAKLLSIDNKIPTAGQKTKAQSLPVVLASDSDPLPVTGAFVFTDPSLAPLNGLLPTQGQVVGGSDGTRLRPLKSKTDGTIFVDGSTVTQPTNVTNFPAIYPISAVSLPLPTGAATAANQTSAIGILTNIEANTPPVGQATMANSSPVVIASNQSPIPITGSITVSGGLTDAELRASPVPVSLTSTTVSNFPASYNIRPLTLATDAVDVTGSLIDIGNFPATQNVSGTVAVSNFPATQAVSVASLPLPSGASTSALQTSSNTILSDILSTLGGTLSVSGPLTDTQLRASPVPVSGTLTANIGTIGGIATEATLNAINTKIPSNPSTDRTLATAPYSNRLSDGTSFYDARQIRALTSSDVVTSNQGGSWTVGINNFPATQPVSGTVAVSNFPATQPISAASLPLPTGASTSALQTSGNTILSDILSALGGTLNTSVTNFPAVQPVSGTVSVSGSVAVTGPLTDAQLRATAVPVSVSSLPLPTGAATETTLSALNTKVPSGLTVTSTRLLVDGSGVTQPVSGTVTANQGGSWTVGVSNFPATQAISAASLPLPTGASTSALQTTGNTSLSNIDTKTPALVSGRVPVDGSGVTQPISAASLPLPAGAATSANQSTIITTLSNILTKFTDGLSRFRITDGTTDVEVKTTISQENDAGLVVRPIPYQPQTFTVTSTNTATALNKHMISFGNATGSTVIIKIKRVFITNVQTAAVTGVIGFFNYNKATSHSGGTLLTPVAHDSANTLNANVTVRTNAAVVGLGPTFNRNIYSTDEVGIGGLGSEEQQLIMSQLIPAYQDTREEKSIQLNANEVFTIQFVTNTTTGLFDLSVVFTQETP